MKTMTTLRATAPVFVLKEARNREESSTTTAAIRNDRRRRQRRRKAAVEPAAPAGVDKAPGTSAVVNGNVAPTVAPTTETQNVTQLNAATETLEDKRRDRPGRPRRRERKHEQPVDIVSRLIRDLTVGTYECMICCESVKPPHYVWSCLTCWAVFHLKCVRKWASSSTKETKSWRCPGCQSTKIDDELELYNCWCGKVDTPIFDKYVTPHGCQNNCGKPPKVGCPHGCHMRCHPGPCPGCSQNAPPQPCYCSRISRTLKCAETNYSDIGWSCGGICGKELSCPNNDQEGVIEKHKCLRECHDGPCGQCDTIVRRDCYCLKHAKSLRCCEQCNISGLQGAWKCEAICSKPFDCGIHKCQQVCCAHRNVSSICPFSIAIITHCPCGRKSIKELILVRGKSRSACTDPVLTCDDICDAELDCGHLCRSKCHTGPHPKCNEIMTYTCGCGSTTTKVTCRQFNNGDYEPKCRNICDATMSCGRHECSAQCCPGKKAAFTRQGRKKKKWIAVWPSPREDIATIESEHICMKICGRRLKCESHYCSVLCHDGPCPSCMEASFEPLICHCGLTQLPPPVRCGTKLPSCPNSCVRSPLCGHSVLDHHCHPDSEPCPPCPYFVTRLCRCGKSSVHNQACYKKVAYCHLKCDGMLSCGFHHCTRVCHEHTLADDVCNELCGKTRPICGHQCLAKCHAPFECDRTKPCTEILLKLCTCGRLSKKVQCGASCSNTDDWKHLPCDDNCARVKRNKMLAEALDIEKDGHVEMELYDEYVFDIYIDHRQFAISIEKQLRDFLRNENKRLAFKPMKQSQRRFIHCLAEAFHLLAQSIDPEPYRSVEVYKTASTEFPSKDIATARLQRRIAPTSAKVESLPIVSGKGYNCVYIEGLIVGILQTQLESSILPILNQLNFPVQISVCFSRT